MEGVSSPTDQQNLVSRFLEIAVGETADTARRCLEATGWKLEEALQLFYVESEGGLAPPSTYSPPPSTYSPPDPPYSPVNDANPSDPGKELVDKSVGQDPDDDIRPPLPVKREILYDNPILHSHGSSGAPGVGSSSFSTHTVVPFRNFGEERNSRVWDAADRSSSSVADKPQNNLASLYRPPFELMFQGSFEKAKDNAKMQNKWLLINLQSNKEFSSHMLNRDTWANEAVAQTIKTNFVFWQVYDDSEEGSKVCNYYKLYSIPVILVIDPITGQKMHSRSGMVQPEVLLEDLLPFMDGSPSAHHVSFSHKRPRESSQAPTSHVQSTPDENNEDEELQRALAASMENFKEISEGDLSDPDGPAEEKVKMPAYLPLPEEPKGVDRGLLCKVGVRLPDGRRVQRNFLRTDPVQLLWSFCYSALKEDARPFRLTQAIPGASKSLDYDAKSTFEESGLANTMVSVTWE